MRGFAQRAEELYSNQGKASGPSFLVSGPVTSSAALSGHLREALPQKSGNPTHGSGWIVNFQPTGSELEVVESHQRQLVEVSLPA